MTRLSMICATEAGFSTNRTKLFALTWVRSVRLSEKIYYSVQDHGQNTYRFDKTSEYLLATFIV